MKNYTRDYIGIYNTFSSYFKAYGGLKAILSSPYFHLSFLFSTSLYVWVHCFGHSPGIIWYELSLSVLPNLLGFSIGAYAILLAVGDAGFWKLLHQRDADDQEDSIFMEINASLAHFVIVQVIALLVALISKLFCFSNLIIAFIGTTLLVYAILMAVAAVMAIFKISKWYQDYTDRIKS